MNWIRRIAYSSILFKPFLKLFYYRWNKRFDLKEGFLSGDGLKQYLGPAQWFQYHGEEEVNFSLPVTTKTDLPKQIEFYAGHSFKVSAGEVYFFDTAFLMGPNAVGVTVDGQIILDTAMDLPNVLHKCSPRLLMNYKRVREEVCYDHVISLVHLFCNSHYVNYFHWVCDSILLVEGAQAYERKFGIRIKLIVNDNLKIFQKEYLKYLGYEEDDLILWKDHKKARVNHLVVAKSRRTGTNMDEIVSPQGMIWLAKSLVHKFQKKNSRFGNRIFLTRQHGDCRRIVNYEEILPVLEKFGFQIVNADELNVAEQIGLFSKMQVLCAPHGAGLTNMIFSSRLKILELIGNVDKPGDFQWYCAYYSMSQALGHDYSFMVGITIPLLKPLKTKQIYDLSIDPVDLDQHLKWLVDGFGR